MRQIIILCKDLITLLNLIGETIIYMTLQRGEYFNGG